MKRVVCIVAILFSCVGTGYVAAQYNWPMFQNNAQRTGKSAEAGPLVPAIKWSYNVGGNIISSPVLGENDTVFINSYAGMLYGIDSAGSFLWSYDDDCRTASSPAIGADKIWVGGGDNNIYALDAQTGGLSWSYLTRGAIFPSPALNGTDTVYIGSFDQNLYSIDSLGVLGWSYSTALCVCW